MLPEVFVLLILLFSLSILGLIANYILSIYALGFALTGLLGLLLLIALASIVATLTLGFLRKKKNYILVGSISCVIWIIFLYFVPGKDWRRNLHEQSRAKGEVLIKSVLDYQKFYGKLPESLNDLIPEFMPQLPIPDFKLSQFYYRKNGANHSFVVGYAAPAWMVCEKSPDKDWGCDD